jgi:hypothetical protein
MDHNAEPVAVMRRSHWASPSKALLACLALQAVEASQFAKLTKFAMLQNLSPRQAEDVFFRVESWGGGMEEASGSQLVNGAFKWVAHSFPWLTNFRPGRMVLPSTDGDAAGLAPAGDMPSPGEVYFCEPELAFDL